MARGRITKRDRTIYLDKNVLHNPRSHYAAGFSPILSPGDALDVKFDGTPSNPRYIDMTIPEGKAPYTFVPVVEKREALLVTPVFHDGRPDPEKLHTGIMHCELEALTPLFVGHYSYPVKQAKPEAIGTDPGDPEQTVLEPLFLEGTPESAVILPGTGIKGMVRHNIGAMFNAPMERVQEQYFSYRPNLGWAEKQQRYKCRAAVVDKVKFEDDKTGKSFRTKWIAVLRVKLLVKLQNEEPQVVFLEREVYEDLQKRFKVDIGSELIGKEVDLPLIEGTGRSRLILPRDKTKNTKNRLHDIRYKIFRYRPGIDGNGKMAQLLKKGENGRYSQPKSDCAVLVPADQIERQDREVRPEILEQYRRSQIELANDQHGHFSRTEYTRLGHLPQFKDAEQIRKSIERNEIEITENQLIYVETDESEKIVSFGQHFRYRWTYADSIRTVNRRLDDKGKPSGEPRAQVHPHKKESVKGEEGDRLTVPRALFGYVCGDNPGSDGIGKKMYARLAGRIAINHAVEQIAKDALLEDRFLSNSNSESPYRFNIPLKILGAPKASAVEHYLEQPENGKLNTYGDLPGTDDSGSGVPLAGRKFYRHQVCDERTHSPFRERDFKKAKSNQSTLARYISREGRKFRFTVRFKDLRDWELGALLLALNPDFARDGLTGICPADVPKDGKKVKYANKLGHGRPLGLGSVFIEIKEIFVLDEHCELQDRSHEASRWLEKARSRSDQSNTRTLLSILNWKERDQSVAYPNADSNIYTYHTQIRARYSIERRKQHGRMPEDYHEPVRPPTPKP